MPTIDPKKIEEWKAATLRLEAVARKHVDAIESGANPVLGIAELVASLSAEGWLGIVFEGMPALLAEREELIRDRDAHRDHAEYKERVFRAAWVLAEEAEQLASAVRPEEWLTGEVDPAAVQLASNRVRGAFEAMRSLSAWQEAPETLYTRQAAEREEMLALLREIEWSASVSLDWEYSKSACPTCGGVKPDEWDGTYDDTLGDVRLGKIRKGHALDCRLAAFLGAKP